MNTVYMCRVCETTNQMNLVLNSESNNLLAMLDQIIPFPIKNSGSVPLCLCIDCCYKLELVYNFKMQYFGTCAKFRSMLNIYAKEEKSIETSTYKLVPNGDEVMLRANSKSETSYNSFITDSKKVEINNISSLSNIPIKTEIGSPDDFRYQTYFGSSLQSGEYLHPEKKKTSIEKVICDEITCIPSKTDCLQTPRNNLDDGPPLFQITSGDRIDHFPTEYDDADIKPTTGEHIIRQIEVKTAIQNVFIGGTDIIPNANTSSAEVHENNQLEYFNQNNRLLTKQSLKNINQKLPEMNKSIETCYTCEYCGKSFKKPRSIRRHRLRHLGPRNFKCDHCGKLFRTLERLKNHQIWDSCADPFKCKECGGVFIDFATLWRHFLWHRNTETINNDDKSLLVPLPDNLATDAEVKSRLYKCDFCGKTYTVGTNLRKHQRMHLNMRPFKCGHCDRSFMTPSALNSHQALHVNPELYKCNECGKSFTRAVALKNHQALHSNPNLFKCDECGRTCTSKFYLKKHMMIHTDTRPFKCEKCGKVFKESYTLRQHEALHANPNLYHCIECGKSFRRSSSYKEHLELHSDPNKYGCSECGRRFTRSQTLRNHIALHKNPNLFACECGKAFRSIESLRHHKLSHLKKKSQSENVLEQLNSTLTIVDLTENSS